MYPVLQPPRWRLIIIRTYPRRISDLQLAGEPGADEGISAQCPKSQCCIAQKVVPLGTTTSYCGTFLQAALAKTYWVMPGKPLSSNTHTNIKCLPADLVR